MPELGPLDAWLTGGGVLTVFGLLGWVIRFLIHQVSSGESLYETRINQLQADQVARDDTFEGQLAQLKNEMSDERARAEKAIISLTTEMQALGVELTSVRSALRECRAESHTAKIELDAVKRIAEGQSREIARLRIEVENLRQES